jgi:very-short-patch-repair endonuclease
MTEIARRLRRDPTPSEAVLWQALRNRRLAERKFRRQEAVGAFVLDFYCPQERLAVEIDGRVHDKPEQQRADAERQALLESLGIRFVRLSASLVEDNLAAALNRIESAFLPSPLVGEGSGVRGSAAGVRDFRLPTEVEFEAAARGKGGRKFPYGDTFDSGRCNTFESHLRRSTPVGIFDNATPEGAFDLSGNVYSWTTTIYDQEQFRYPYKAEDGRENLNSTSVLRVLRGGSWYLNQYRARAVYRHVSNPFVRYGDSGFRLVCSSPIMNR